MRDIGYPLAWPVGHPRVESWRRQQSKFKTSLAQARDSLMHELHALGAGDIVISSNVGGLSARQPDDPGVAAYFKLDGEQHVIAVDKWAKVEDNLRALGKTIEAMRGIERWGTSGMMKRAFGAFKALPATTTRTWREVLQAPHDTTLENARDLYRLYARIDHPDVGGSHERMAELNAAMEAAEEELGRKANRR